MPPVDVKQIYIGEHQVGIVGLDGVLAEVKAMGMRDDVGIARVLLEKIRASNYVPAGAEEKYRLALLEEYRLYTGEISCRPRGERLPKIRVSGAGCPRCKGVERIVSAPPEDPAE